MRSGCFTLVECKVPKATYMEEVLWSPQPVGRGHLKKVVTEQGASSLWVKLLKLRKLSQDASAHFSLLLY